MGYTTTITNNKVSLNLAKVGAQGAIGPIGPQGTSVTSVEVNAQDQLVIGTSDGGTFVTTNTVVGDDGAAAATISSVAVSDTGVLTLTLSDNTVLTATGVSKGDDGQDGIDGADATITVGTTTTGVEGTNAIVTNTGASAQDAVFNFTIPVGASGTDGTTPVKGVDYDDGSAATISVGSVTTGVEGTSASVTNIGTSSEATFDFTIPVGASGSDGNAGTIAVGTVSSAAAGTFPVVANSGTASDAVFNFTIPNGNSGLDGDDGDAATISVGTVTTGAAGTSATVNNSGTTSAATLDFTIPRGANGNDGNNATVTAGTTSNLASGSNATVVNSGSNQNAVFNFGIPAGQSGADGNDGTSVTGANIATDGDVEFTLTDATGTDTTITAGNFDSRYLSLSETSPQTLSGTIEVDTIDNATVSTPVTIASSDGLRVGRSTYSTSELATTTQVVTNGADGAVYVAARNDTTLASGDFIGAYLFSSNDTSSLENHYAGMWSTAVSTAKMELKFSANRDMYEQAKEHMKLDINGNLILGRTEDDGSGGTINYGTDFTLLAGSIIMENGTVDGRNVANDGNKLDTIETLADVTNTASVTAAGALMDSEVTNLADVKSFSTADYATATQGTKADTALQSVPAQSFDSITGKPTTIAGYGITDSLALGVTATTALAGNTTLFDGAYGSLSGTPTIPTNNNQLTNGAGYITSFTNTTYSGGDGIDLTGTVFSHADTSSQASSDNSGRTYIQDITLDTYGHITGLATATETVTDTTYSSSDFDHDSLNNYVANEHIDWTAAQTDNIDAGNYTNTTYSGGDGLTLSGTAFNINEDQRGHIAKIGKTSTDYIDITSANIDFRLDNNLDMRLEDTGNLHVDGNVVAYSTTTSDERLKKDIVKIDNALDKVGQLNGYTFEYLNDGKKSAGILAQEVEAVLPSAVSEMKLPLKSDDDQEYKVVQYDQLHGLLIEAIKELKAEIETLKGE